MKAVYDEASQLARENKDFVIATVVHTQGSTPQKPGAALLVREDGSTVGTLGGGCVEGDIWFAAKEALREQSGPLYKRYYLNEDIAARDGLVCGGTMFFFIEPFLERNPHADLSAEVADAYAGGPSLSIATLVTSDRLPNGARIVVREDGVSEGTLGDAALDAEAIATARAVMPMGKTARLRNNEGDEVFVEGYTAPALMALIGGGHVNLQVARLAQMMGFRVMVTDDRREFANTERFPDGGGGQRRVLRQGRRRVPCNAEHGHRDRHAGASLRRRGDGGSGTHRRRICRPAGQQAQDHHDLRVAAQEGPA